MRNEYSVSNGVAQVYLIGKWGGCCLFDEADFPAIARFNAWRNSGGPVGYAVIGNCLAMHRILLNLVPGDGLFVDHINGNGLDNRRVNLRIVSRAENMQNSKLQKNNKTGFPGVFYEKGRHRWRADVRAFGRRRSACRGSKEDAIMAALDLRAEMGTAFPEQHPLSRHKLELSA